MIAQNNVVDVLLVIDDPGETELILRNFRFANLGNVLKTLGSKDELEHFLFGGDGPAPRLMLIDYRLRLLDVPAFLSKVRATDRLKDVPVVVFTHDEEEERQVLRVASTLTACLRKPFSFERFIARISEIGLYWVIVDAPAEEGYTSRR